MFNTKVIISIGALIFFTAAAGVIMLGLNQRQTTRPDAQQAIDTLKCPIGSVDPDLTGRCPSGFVPVPVSPSAGGPQSIGDGNIDTDTFGTGTFDGGDIGPTNSSLISNTPTPPVIGFCCVPIGQSTPTPSPTVPTIPTPSTCPTGGEQLTVTSENGCSATSRCDFSVDSNGGTQIATRSLWSDGIFDFGAQESATLRFDERTFTYSTPGTYDISLTCGNTVCTKQIVLTDIVDPGTCTTPTVTVPSPTPTATPEVTESIPTLTLTPTPPACRIPVPILQFRCPECSQR